MDAKRRLGSYDYEYEGKFGRTVSELGRGESIHYLDVARLLHLMDSNLFYSIDSIINCIIPLH